MTHSYQPRIGTAPRALAILVATTLLGGCAVGPDFKKPDAPKVSGYTPAPAPSSVAGAPGTAGDEQHFVNGADITADWWTLFHSKALDDLIALAIQNNSDLKAAQAALKQANENVLAQKGRLFSRR